MFYDTFAELCSEKKISESKAAESVGLNRSAVVKWKKGAVPSGQTISKLADFFGVSVDYLLGMESEKTTTPGGGRKSAGVRIPVLGEVAAGIPIEAITDILDYEEIDEAMARTGDFFGLRIKGASMEPRMTEGDVVIVRKQESADSGDTVVVLVNGNSATVKKIKYGPDGITLIPTNPSYDPMFYSAAEVESLPVRVIGRVAELRAKY